MKESVIVLHLLQPKLCYTCEAPSFYFPPLSLCGETLVTSEQQCLLQALFWALGAVMTFTCGLSAQPPYPLSAEVRENITFSFLFHMLNSHREPQNCINPNCHGQIWQGTFPTRKQKCGDHLSACAHMPGCVWELGYAEQLLPSTTLHLAVAATSKLPCRLRSHLLHCLEWNWVFGDYPVRWRKKWVKGIKLGCCKEKRSVFFSVGRQNWWAAHLVKTTPLSREEWRIPITCAFTGRLNTLGEVKT